MIYSFSGNTRTKVYEESISERGDNIDDVSGAIPYSQATSTNN